MLTTLAPLGGALLLLVAILAPGHLLARLWIGLDRRDPLVLLLSELALGTTLWAVLLFGLASVGLYQPPVVLILVLAGVGCAIPAWRLRRRNQELDQETAPEPAREDDETAAQSDEASDSPLNPPLVLVRLTNLGLSAALLLVLGVLLIQALRPDLSWDADVYHLTVPRLFLEHGGFYAIPQNVYSHWPLATQLIYGVALALQGPVTAKLLHLVFGLATLGCIVALTRPRAAAVGMILFLLNPVVLYEMRIAYVDLASAFFLGMTVVSWKLASGVRDPDRGDRHQQRPWSLLALCCGMLVAIKLNGLFGPVALLIALAVSTWMGPRKPGSEALLTARRAALVLGVCFAFGIVWLVKSFLLTGNPFYPLLWETFGGPDWSAQLADQHSRWQRSIGRGRELVDYVLLPLRLITESRTGYGNFDGAISRAWLVALPLALLASWRDRLSRVCVITSAVLFVSWAATSQQTRFLIPVLALLSVAAARGVDRLTLALPRRVDAVVNAVLAAAFIALLVSASWVYVRQTPGLVRDLIVHGNELTGEHPVYRTIDEQLPKDARLLLLGTNHGFFVRRPFVADSFFEASQIIDRFRRQQSPSEAVAELRTMGITHVLIDSRASQMPYPPSLTNAINDPTIFQPIHRSQDGRFIVAALRSAAASP